MSEWDRYFFSRTAMVIRTEFMGNLSETKRLTEQDVHMRQFTSSSIGSLTNSARSDMPVILKAKTGQLDERTKDPTSRHETKGNSVAILAQESSCCQALLASNPKWLRSRLLRVLNFWRLQLISSLHGLGVDAALTSHRVWVRWFSCHASVSLLLPCFGARAAIGCETGCSP